MWHSEDTVVLQQPWTLYSITTLLLWCTIEKYFGFLYAICLNNAQCEYTVKQQVELETHDNFASFGFHK